MNTHGMWTHGSDDHGESDAERARAKEREQQRAIASANHLARARMNRLLVGGRAHARKRGLS